MKVLTKAYNADGACGKAGGVGPLWRWIFLRIKAPRAAGVV